jgi:hypothetical protein
MLGFALSRPAEPVPRDAACSHEWRTVMPAASPDLLTASVSEPDPANPIAHELDAKGPAR